MAIEGTTRFDKVKAFEKKYLDDKVSRKKDRIRQKSERNAERHSTAIVSAPTEAYRQGWDRMMAARKAKEEEPTCEKCNGTGKIVWDRRLIACGDCS